MQLHNWRERLRTGTSGVLLLLLVLFTTRTLAYLLKAALPVAHAVDKTAGLSPIIWGSTAVIMLLALLSRKRTLRSLALMCGMMVLTLWGLLFAWSGGVPSLLLYGSPYLAIAGLVLYTVWRGSAFELHICGGDDIARTRSG